MSVHRSTIPPTGTETPDDVTSMSGPPGRPAAPTRTARRSRVEAVAFVLIWIILGVLLPLGLAAYLLVGVPLAVGFQLLVRRRPLRELWIRRGARSRRRPADLAVTIGLTLVMLASFVVLFPVTEEADAANMLWTLGILGVIFAVGVLVHRRAALASGIALTLVSGLLYGMAPTLAHEHSGDPQILAELARHEGFRDLAVAVIDLDDSQPVRFANTGSTPTTTFEVGSITKALTGLVIADEVRRGEIDLTDSVSDYLPVTGSVAGAATLQDLVTHHAGYPALGAGTLHRAIWKMPLGLDVLNTSRDDVLQEIRDTELDGRGSYAYSNLGAAAAGQAAAVAAGMAYPELMRTRLFAPLGMDDTAIQTTELVAGGEATMGRPVQPWAMDGYASAGAVVSTTRDMSVLALAVLRGTAPGLDAMTPTATTDSGNTRIGMFWHTTHWANGQTVTWHNGGSGGYTAYLGFDLEHHKAVIVLSDVAKSVDDIGHRLLVQLN